MKYENDQETDFLIWWLNGNTKRNRKNLTKRLKNRKNIWIWKNFLKRSRKYGMVLEPETWIEIEKTLLDRNRRMTVERQLKSDLIFQGDILKWLPKNFWTRKRIWLSNRISKLKKEYGSELGIWTWSWTKNISGSLKTDCESELSYQIVILNGNVELVNENVAKKTKRVWTTKLSEKPDWSGKKESELVRSMGLYMFLNPVIESEKVERFRP